MLNLKTNWCTATYLRGKGELIVMTVVTSGNSAVVNTDDVILVSHNDALAGRNPAADVPSGTYAVRLADIVGVVT